MVEVQSAGRTTSSAVAAILSNAVILRLTINRPTNSKSIPKNLIGINADKAWITSHKRLLNSKEFRAIGKVHSRIRDKYLRGVALPSPFGMGAYVIPLSIVEEVDAQLVRLSEEVIERVEAFCAVYSSAVDTAESRLGPAFNRADYPDVDVFRSRYSVKWAWLSLNTPDSLPAEFARRAQVRAEEQWAETLGTWETLLAKELTQFITHAVEMLTPDENGRGKGFKATFVPNIQEFLTAFGARNLIGSRELADLAERAKQVISGMDTVTLKKDTDARDTVRNGFAAIRDELATLVITKPTRMFNWDDEEGGDDGRP